MGKRFVSFDWALKWWLRRKDNFDVLEGFLSVLLQDDIKIAEVLEDLSDRPPHQKLLNRLDLMAHNQKGELVFIELQTLWEYGGFHSLANRVSQSISELIRESIGQDKVSKVISVNLIYLCLDDCEDYVYFGKSEVCGLHCNDRLLLSDGSQTVQPEFYFIRLDKFDEIIRNPLDEWLCFIKREDIDNEFKARGLAAADEKLNKCKLSNSELYAYGEWVEDRRCERSTMKSAIWQGEWNQTISSARKLLHILDDQQISEATGLSMKAIKKLRAGESLSC